MKRDPRVQPRRPQIRNFRPPQSEEGPNEKTPWDRLADMVDPLAQARAERVIERVKEACYERHASVDELTWTAYEGIIQGTNEELRQLLTAVQHRLQLNLMLTDHDEPPLSREEAWRLLDVIKQSSDLLDAQPPRNDIACAFLDLDLAAVELSDLIRDRLKKEGLESTVEASLEPAPVRVDGDRFGEAVMVLLESLLEDAGGPQGVVEVRWRGQQARVFVGTDPPSVPKHELQQSLDKRASIRDPALDVPLARAVIQHHEGEVRVHETEEGATGFCCVLPALEPLGRGPEGKGA